MDLAALAARRACGDRDGGYVPGRAWQDPAGPRAGLGVPSSQAGGPPGAGRAACQQPGVTAAASLRAGLDLGWVPPEGTTTVVGTGWRGRAGFAGHGGAHVYQERASFSQYGGHVFPRAGLLTQPRSRGRDPAAIPVAAGWPGML